MSLLRRAMIVSLCAVQLAVLAEPQTTAAADAGREKKPDGFFELLYRYGNSPHSGGVEMRWCEAPGGVLEMWGSGHAFLSDDEVVSSLGVGVQFRMNLKWRPVEPYAGLGFSTSYGGYGDFGSRRHEKYYNFKRSFLLACEPEAGIHFWLNERFRLSAFARYTVTSEGRDFDYDSYGLMVGWGF